jgi:CheY-like chemotaxis protein
LILSVSYDGTLLKTRQLILESAGYAVKSVRTLKHALALCKSSTQFDLLIVGHSIPQPEKQELMEAFRVKRPAVPVVALKKGGEETVRGADLWIEPRPTVLLTTVAKLTSPRKTAAC